MSPFAKVLLPGAVILIAAGLILLGSWHAAAFSGGNSALDVYSAAGIESFLQRVLEDHEAFAARISAGSSGTLARQIAAGAPADLFLSTAWQWIAYLDERGELVEHAVLARAEMVLVRQASRRTAGVAAGVAADDRVEGAEWAGPFSGRFAIADPLHAPAGVYAQAVLDYYGTDSTARIITARDVRSAQRLVELGEADYGIVYAGDARRSPLLSVVHLFAPDTHPPALFYLALVSESKAQTRELYDFLLSQAAGSVLQDFGMQRVQGGSQFSVGRESR